MLPCSSGADALDLIRQRRVDLVLTAYLVPAIDGLQLISAVRAFDAHLPIVMISNVPVGAIALARGATGFFSKRSVWTELGNTVRTVFGAPIPVTT
jgi:CheY-like chemotaxis protein